MIISTNQGLKMKGALDYFNPELISVEERSRIFYGELNEGDFCTSHYNCHNIDRTYNGIHNYLKTKAKYTINCMREVANEFSN
jgi:hypothetical protein